MTYLVIGGTGRVGRLVAERLRQRGESVLTAGRRRADLRLDLAGAVPDDILDGVDGVVVSVEPPANEAGATALLHHGVAQVAKLAADKGIQLVLVSQIYVTRQERHPEMAWVMPGRVGGEEALRASGAPYTIIRPSWLTDAPAGGFRFEQGDTGDGTISRDAVAQACVAALFSKDAQGKTFEMYDDTAVPDLGAAFAALRSDVPA